MCNWHNLQSAYLGCFCYKESIIDGGFSLESCYSARPSTMFFGYSKRRYIWKSHILDPRVGGDTKISKYRYIYIVYDAEILASVNVVVSQVNKSTLFRSSGNFGINRCLILSEWQQFTRRYEYTIQSATFSNFLFLSGPWVSLALFALASIDPKYMHQSLWIQKIAVAFTDPKCLLYLAFTDPENYFNHRTKKLLWHSEFQKFLKYQPAISWVMSHYSSYKGKAY